MERNIKALNELPIKRILRLKASSLYKQQTNVEPRQQYSETCWLQLIHTTSIEDVAITRSQACCASSTFSVQSFRVFVWLDSICCLCMSNEESASRPSLFFAKHALTCSRVCMIISAQVQYCKFKSLELDGPKTKCFKEKKRHVFSVSSPSKLDVTIPNSVQLDNTDHPDMHARYQSRANGVVEIR